MRYTPSGAPVAAFSLAVSRTWTKDGQKQEKTTWLKITCWNKLAEIVGEYVKQGMKVMVQGELEEARTWTDKDGNTRASLEVTAQNVKFLTSAKDSNDSTQNVTVEDAEAIPF